MKKNIMKTIALIGMSILFLACGSEATNKSTQVIKIGITQIVEHPSLDDIRRGIEDSLKVSNLDKEIEFIFKNAGGDFGTASLIANSFNDTVDIAVGITTPSAQSLYNAVKDKPIFFSAVTNPELAGLDGDNITGVSDVSPVKKQIKLIQQLLPKAKKIGIIYNTSEQNSTYLTKILTEAAEEKGLIVIKRGITNVTEMASALDSLLDEIDVLYTGIDNTIASAYPIIVEKQILKIFLLLGQRKNMLIVELWQ